jgi:hypothetical protein
VAEATKEQKDAEGKLGKGDRDGGSAAQGRAVGKLDEAIRRLEEIVRQARKEERERTLTDLLARCKKMLAVEEEVRHGSAALHRDLAKQQGGKPTLAQASVSNKLADRQNDNLKECAATLKIVETEGSAVAFAEVFEQLIRDMDAVHNRLARVEIDRVTLAIEDDVIGTLKDAIAALEKAIRDSATDDNPRRPGGAAGKPRLVDQLQQLKMIHALQRRVSERTALYGKQFPGEQAPSPSTALTAGDRARLAQVEKELKDLAGRQDRIARATRSVGKDSPSGERPID